MDFFSKEKIGEGQAASAPHYRGTVLVVDDEDVMRRTAVNILEKLGYTVITASDGEEAVEIFREKSSQILITLLDLSMPKMSGSDAYAAMKEMDPEVKAILISGFEDERVEAALELGIDGFIKKPYSMVNLAQEVKRIIGG